MTVVLDCPVKAAETTSTANVNNNLTSNKDFVLTGRN